MKIGARAVLFMKFHLAMYRETKCLEAKNSFVKCMYTKPLFYALIAFPQKWQQIKKSSMKSDIPIRSIKILEG